MHDSTRTALAVCLSLATFAAASLGCGGSDSPGGGGAGASAAHGSGAGAGTSTSHGSETGTSSAGGASTGTGAGTTTSTATSTATTTTTSSSGTGGSDPNSGPPAGNPDGHCDVPAEAAQEDTSSPTTVIGDGTPASCTSAAVVAGVAAGGIITFACGPSPLTITLDETAKIFNDKGVGPNGKIVLDGGGLITLSGNGAHRILYQDTCDQAQVWTTSHCQDQDSPQLTVQNLTFIDGNATGQAEEGGGGGAILVRGGRFKIVNSRFFHGACEATGPDLGGAAVRVLSQSQNLPVYVVNSTFGGTAALGGSCSNGGGLSSIGVSYTVLNSLFTNNQAIGNGANPAQPNTPGGGSGGAIYNDGDDYTLTLCGVKMTDNHANEGGGAIFFVSNDGSGHLVIHDSFLSNNPSDGFETPGYPGIYVHTNATPDVQSSTIQ